ncbi:MAG TPA: hypothetical protein VGS59_07455 [Candidatus Acidoferrales bacterium]|nr:hypothetical protein [Candidatus Acidoferrales bacterium]
MANDRFVNQKLGKRNSRRSALLKSEARLRPSSPKSWASKPLDAKTRAHKP